MARERIRFDESIGNRRVINDLRLVVRVLQWMGEIAYCHSITTDSISSIFIEDLIEDELMFALFPLIFAFPLWDAFRQLEVPYESLLAIASVVCGEDAHLVCDLASRRTCSAHRQLLICTALRMCVCIR
ncbi:hypothetical protein PMAYCL1PPCAC_18352, partial [Pristionchus mayeri]